MSFVNQLLISTVLFVLILLFFSINLTEVKNVLNKSFINLREFSIIKLSASSFILLICSTILIIPQSRNKLGEFVDKLFSYPISVLDEFFS